MFAVLSKVTVLKIKKHYAVRYTSGNNFGACIRIHLTGVAVHNSGQSGSKRCKFESSHWVK